MVNTMLADILVVRGAMASAAMVLTKFAGNILDSARVQRKEDDYVELNN